MPRMQRKTTTRSSSSDGGAGEEARRTESDASGNGSDDLAAIEGLLAELLLVARAIAYNTSRRLVEPKTYLEKVKEEYGDIG